MDENRSPARYTLLVDLEHFGFPLIVTLLILINLVIIMVLIIKVSLLITIIVHHLNLSCASWSRISYDRLLWAFGFLFEQSFINDLVFKKAGETERIDILIKPKVGADTQLTIAIDARLLRVSNIMVILVNE